MCTGKIETLMVAVLHYLSTMIFRICPSQHWKTTRNQFENKTFHFVASWYHPPGGDLVELELQLKSFESQLDKTSDIHKGNKPTSVHVLGRKCSNAPKRNWKSLTNVSTICKSTKRGMHRY